MSGDQIDGEAVESFCPDRFTGLGSSGAGHASTVFTALALWLVAGVAIPLFIVSMLSREECSERYAPLRSAARAENHAWWSFEPKRYSAPPERVDRR